MPKLIVKTGNRAGMEYEVRDGIIIGRRPEVPIHIEDVKSSREHAKIVSHGDGFVLFDLESTNGTFVNGSRTGRARLIHGDIIRIGRTELVFHDPSSSSIPAVTPEPGTAATPTGPKQKKIDLGLPPPKKIRLDVPPAKKVNVKLESKRPRRDKRR